MKRASKLLGLLLITVSLAGFTVACGGDKKEGEGGATPAEGEAKPAEDEAKPAEGEAKPAEGEAKPDKPAAPSAEVVALKGIAKTIINSYKAKDLAKLSEFAPAEMAAKIKTLGPDDPMFKNFFDETKWRWKVAQTWDGKLHAVRMKGAEEAWVKYADMEGDEVAVVKLEKREGKWLFKDFSSPSAKRWSEWGEAKE